MDSRTIARVASGVKAHLTAAGTGHIQGGETVSYNYDDLLIESVAVRRRRLGGALMFGRERLRRDWSDRVKTFVGGAFLAALAATGCVAVSFVTNLLANDDSLRPNKQVTPPAVTRTTTSTAPAGVPVTPSTTRSPRPRPTSTPPPVRPKPTRTPTAPKTTPKPKATPSTKKSTSRPPTSTPATKKSTSSKAPAKSPSSTRTTP